MTCALLCGKCVARAAWHLALPVSVADTCFARGALPSSQTCLSVADELPTLSVVPSCCCALSVHRMEQRKG